MKFVFNTLEDYAGRSLDVRETIRRAASYPWCITCEGVFVEVNDAFCRLVGYTEQELTGADFTLLVKGAFTAIPEEDYAKYLSKEKQIPSVWTISRKSGEPIQIFVELLNGPDESGKIYVLTVVRPINNA